jgi:hypothetical protein
MILIRTDHPYLRVNVTPFSLLRFFLACVSSSASSAACVSSSRMLLPVLSLSRPISPTCHATAHCRASHRIPRPPLWSPSMLVLSQHPHPNSTYGVAAHRRASRHRPRPPLWSPSTLVLSHHPNPNST